MKKLTLAALATAMASPAFAHLETVPHMHGNDAIFLALGGAVIAAAALLAATR